MHRKLKGIVSRIVRSVVMYGVKVFAPWPLSPRRQQPAGEKGAEWYDASFDASEYWSHHYTTSEYYFLWSVIVDRIKKIDAKSILEIGCGSGQLASLLADKVECKYIGFDFSEKRITCARKMCPGFLFIQQDAFKTELFEKSDYDTVICTEFLEHVEADTKVLTRIRKGSKFYGTVPNFPFVSHVRYFVNEKEVRSRYDQYFRDLSVDTFLADSKGKVFYLLEGTIR